MSCPAPRQSGNPYDLANEYERDGYEAETARLNALADFLQRGVMLRHEDGQLPGRLRADYDAACSEALEAIRRLADRS